MKNKIETPTIIDFWSGNRSLARQEYEREILFALLKVTEEEYGKCLIKENTAEYPGKMESLAFSEQNHDVLVSVAGNKKFENTKAIIIPIPILKNILGQRVLIIREDDKKQFEKIKERQSIQALRLGIPETWSDADIFRHNEFNVVENGNFDDIFKRLQNKEFDYLSFGANEVLGIFKNKTTNLKGLMIDDNILLSYRFPLYFYVHPDKYKLAKRIEIGLKKLLSSGELDQIFDAFYGKIKEQLHLDKRRTFVLHNPLLPEKF
ncbi:transporter substrate-binding domain-containing protein [Psychroflexus planctonicus]|uniref:Solute-binding protein family 3/N-terminal domain-containing protein n=1 Tax=Psychroflexus planctonicus TaxID=1526575 RepID=A0ABQ1SFC3_9FLAO|nr:transporter substrate-binding domain-containing protein [Psychroflexus planctonicus]GGE30061.1 hypothetical protein GCM10010832_08170 [Psychroflexus planctonicus]